MFVSDVAVGLQADGIHRESQLHRVQQGRVQKVRRLTARHTHGNVLNGRESFGYCSPVHPAAALLWWRNTSSGSSRQRRWLWRLSSPYWWSSVSAGWIASRPKRSAGRSNPSRTRTASSFHPAAEYEQQVEFKRFSLGVWTGINQD